jgi:hypothetical protein
MDAFDERVRGEHLQRPAIGHGNRRVVADPDQQFARPGGDAPADSIDQRPLAGFGDALGVMG